MKIKWSSSFDAPKGGRQFCSDLGMLGFRFLLERLHGMQLTRFLLMAPVCFGHQNCFAASVTNDVCDAFV